MTAKASTSPYGCCEHPFNLPLLAASSGAAYVARWTALHIRRLTTAIKEAITKRGFSFVEVIAPCSTLYARLNKLGTGLDLMKFYHDNSIIRHGADLKDVDIEYQSKIVVGKFVDIEKPTYLDCLNENNKRVFGDKYKPYGGDDGDN
jgi:2-oxoglutarate ferredoxin oxidoreductase subunit beta